MKKLIIASLLMTITALHSIAGPIVTIRLEIGRKSLGCTKFGFCDWGVSVDSRAATAGSVQINENTNTLVIVLKKEAIVGNEEYFQGNTVTFEETIAVPSDIMRALGVTTRMAINAGTYKLTKTVAGYQIDVPLN